jgi:hypothetical protein
MSEGKANLMVQHVGFLLASKVEFAAHIRSSRNTPPSTVVTPTVFQRLLPLLHRCKQLALYLNPIDLEIFAETCQNIKWLSLKSLHMEQTTYTGTIPKSLPFVFAQAPVLDTTCMPMFFLIVLRLPLRQITFMSGFFRCDSSLGSLAAAHYVLRNSLKLKKAYLGMLGSADHPIPSSEWPDDPTSLELDLPELEELDIEPRHYGRNTQDLCVVITAPNLSWVAISAVFVKEAHDMLVRSKCLNRLRAITIRANQTGDADSVGRLLEKLPKLEILRLQDADAVGYSCPGSWEEAIAHIIAAAVTQCPSIKTIVISARFDFNANLVFKTLDPLVAKHGIDSTLWRVNMFPECCYTTSMVLWPHE